MKYRDRYNRNREGEDIDPMGSLVNLFDVSMVFAVALMVAFVIHGISDSRRCDICEKCGESGYGNYC